MKCKHCKREINSLARGYCPPCKRSNSYLIEEFNTQELLQELGKRLKAKEIKLDELIKALNEKQLLCK